MQDILFIQGGGEGAYEEDKALTDYLQMSLGNAYTVHYPYLSGLEHLDYHSLKSQFQDTLSTITAQSLMVTHSLGGASLLKYLSEARNAPSLASLFLIAPPYKVKDGDWGTDDFALEVDFHRTLPIIHRLVVYHSRDDDFIPFEQHAQWSEKLPHADMQALDGYDHSFSNQAFAELPKAVRSSTEKLRSKTGGNS